MSFWPIAVSVSTVSNSAPIPLIVFPLCGFALFLAALRFHPFLAGLFRFGTLRPFLLSFLAGRLFRSFFLACPTLFLGLAGSLLL